MSTDNTLSQADLAALRAQVRANPACADALTAKDCHALAAIMSAGRMRANNREIGNGTILEVLGLTAGNAFLDVLDTPDYRHVKPLVEQGRLLIGSPLVQETVQAMVGSQALTQAQADALCALGLDPYPYTALELAEAVFNADGTEK